MVEIRRAGVEDARGIAEVVVGAWKVAYRGIVPDEVLDRQSVDARATQWATHVDAYTVFVACDGDAVIGFVGLDPTAAEIGALYVAPERWGTGAGRALLRQATAALVDAGHRMASLWVFEQNPRARRFYESAGWRPDGAVRRDDAHGNADEIRYRTMLSPIPDGVSAAMDRADARGFARSSVPGVGRLLMVLAAAVPRSGRILELGTGAGVGVAWLLEGLAGRDDVEVVTVDIDPAAASPDWPASVWFFCGDGLDALTTLGTFDLIFADSPAGKSTGLDRTSAALKPGGTLVVDDTWPFSSEEGDWQATIADVRRTLLGHPALVATELADGSGVIVAVRRR